MAQTIQRLLSGQLSAGQYRIFERETLSGWDRLVLVACPRCTCLSELPSTAHVSKSGKLKHEWRCMLCEHREWLVLESWEP